MRTTILDDLIEADRIVLGGLAAYDRAMANAWAQCAESLAGDGYSADEIEEARESDSARIRASRVELHRDLWTQALIAVSAGNGRDITSGKNSEKRGSVDE
jgi:hypothetical protein